MVEGIDLDELWGGEEVKLEIGGCDEWGKMRCGIDLID